MKTEYIRKLINYRQLFIFLISAIMYFLGGGLAHYLGAKFQPVEFFLGLLWIVCLHFSGFLLMTYFSSSKYLIEDEEVNEWFDKNRKIFLQLAYLTLTICGFVVVYFIIRRNISIFLGTILLLTIFGLVGLIISPFNLANKGYLEIMLAIFQGSLIPATSFFILTNDYHNLLLFITFPMTCLAIASFLAYNFSTFARDQIIGRKTLLRSLTWQRGIPIHNLLLIVVYGFYISGFILRFPPRFIWPALLTFPLACLQIFWLFRISQGGRPIWGFFNALITSVYGLSAYFIAFTFWIR